MSFLRIFLLVRVLLGYIDNRSPWRDHMRKRDLKQAGFSMVELLVAIVILAVGLLGLAVPHPNVGDHRIADRASGNCVQWLKF